MGEPQFRARRRSRRWFLWTGAGAVGAGVSAVTAVHAVGAAPARALLAAAPAAAPADTAVQPVGGAGLFDVDPSQAGVSQSPTAVVSGDIAALPLDLEF